MNVVVPLLLLLMVVMMIHVFVYVCATLLEKRDGTVTKIENVFLSNRKS